MVKKLLASFLIVFSLSSVLLADESVEDDLSGFGEEVLGDLDGFADEESVDLEGFNEEEEKPEIVQSTRPQADNFTMSGNIAFKTSAGYKKHKVDGVEYSGLNQAQTSLYLQLDGKLSPDWKVRISGDAFYDAIYDIRSGKNFRQEVKNEYRTQLRLDDTYVQGRLSSDLDVKAGRQIVVWGKSDTIRVTDVINPLDNRQPGMTDIEDLRLSVGMAKFDYYVDAWNISAMIIPENRIMLEATPRSEFFPVDNIFSGAPDPFLSLKTPATSWDNMQYALALNGVFSGWDLSFYAAEVLDQKWHFDKVQGSAPLSSINRVVSKIKMLGSSVNVASGSWLIKAEAAYLNGVKYNTTADEKNRLDALIGFDYTGFKDTVVSLEIANRHIFDYEQQMKNQADFTEQNEMQSALRVTKSFLNETVTITGLITMFGSSLDNGGFSRFWLEYEIMDALSANVGIVDYTGGDKPFMEGIKDNDRVFADIRYSF